MTAAPPLALRIDPSRNLAVLPDGQRVVWQRRWTGEFLALLVQQGRHDLAVDHAMLDTHLARRGQSARLAAVSILRLLETLQTFLDGLPERPLILEHPPRKASLGPWRLRWRLPLAIVIDGEPGADQADSIDPPADLFTALFDGPPGQIDRLHALLLSLISSDAFHAIGDHASSHEVLQSCRELPLSANGRVLIGLRDALCLKRIGRFEDARQLLRALAHLPDVSDRSALASVQFLFDRIDYDADPGGQHTRLWASCAAPTRVQLPDRHLLAQWHNLRALLCRRRSEAAGHADPVLHILALRHLESAFHHALMQRDNEGLLAYAANLALHLTSVLPAGWSTARQVMAWHELVLVCMDKLGVGGDNAWETIFLAQFWLDHEDELGALDHDPAHKGWMPVIGNLHPRDAAYHVAMVQRVQASGDARQIALAWLCCWRHARQHLPPHDELPIRLALIKAVKAEADLPQRLRREGYGDWLDRLGIPCKD
ncbi:hypothetical protein [Sphaerotilus mobilis]|uniref:Uncharacterized protein n=1 Tax=Sphaerotilus mobilis TaxID=47994 RepID=A0A4Q7LTR9_9BURK|nr:hypothetical protein [Sphaerotilus mobilis]RZS57219.1 hypothetical protein EV685_1787 [Sphaerotilus mobilis]